MWLQVALFVASLVISYVLQPKPIRPKAAAFEDFDFPTVDEGTPQILVFGDVWLTDWTVIGIGNYRNSPIKVKQKGLFGSKSTTTGYRYYMTLHMGLCRGMDDLLEIKVSDRTAWSGSAANETIIDINQRGLFGGDKGEGGIDGVLHLMRGHENQNTPPFLQELYGAVPNYRGVVTFVYDGLICANSPYPKPWSFRIRRVVSNWDNDAVWYQDKAVIWLDGNRIKAMNPAHIIYQAQTDRSWGRGFSASQLDLASFERAADQLYQEKFGLCLGWRRQNSLKEFIQEILNTIGAALFVDRTTGLWRLELIRSEDASTIPTFTMENGLLSVEEDNNAAIDVASNQIVVSYRDPISNQDKTTYAENIAAIQQHGVILENKTYSGIPTAHLAGRIAARDLKVTQSSLKRFKLIFDRRAYAIQPVSVFKISIPEQGIDSIIVRAIRVDHDSVTNGKITVTVVQDVFGLPDTNYIQEQESLWQAPNYTAKPVISQRVYELPFAELRQEFLQADLLMMTNQGYVGIVAQQPNSLHLDYDILSKRSADADYLETGRGEFAFVFSVHDAIPQSATSTVISLNNVIDVNVGVGDRALLGDEIVYVEAVDREANQITIARGCIDTVPMAYEANTSIWFYSGNAGVIERSYNSSQTINIKLLSNTAQDQLSAVAAQALDFTLTNRLNRPYPPANVKINNQYYPSEITGDLTVSWAHRNRLTQNTFEQMRFVDGTAIAEENVSYQLTIYDANNQVLMRQSELTDTSYTWLVPQVFVGDLTLVCDVQMSGTAGSRTLIDTSPNALSIENEGVIIQADSDAPAGSSAFFDIASMRTGFSAGLNYTSDFCLEGRIKTPESSSSAAMMLSFAFELASATDQLSNGNTASPLIISMGFHQGVFGIDLQGEDQYGQPVFTGFNQNVDAHSFVDWAIEKIGNEITVYFDGVAAGVVNTIVTLSDSDPRALFINTRNTDLGFGFNGLRFTQKTGGRYAGNYTPSAFATSTNDPDWADVSLLIAMTGSDGGTSFTDLSSNALEVTSSLAVVIQADNAAHGGSLAQFLKPYLRVPYHADLELRDKSFLIQGAVKTTFSVVQTIFQIEQSMTLHIDHEKLTLINADESEQVQCLFYYPTNTYFEWAVERDATTGVTKITIGEFSASATFNPSAITDGALIIGQFASVVGSMHKFSINTVDGDQGMTPNVTNPLRIELASQRDGLASHQSYISTVSIVAEA